MNFRLLIFHLIGKEIELYKFQVSILLCHKTSNNRTIIIFLICTILISICNAQSERKEVFNEILQSYAEVSLPIKDFLSLNTENTIDAKLLNRLLFDLQDGKAKHYVKDTLYRITSYGRISEEPFNYTDSKKEGDEWIDFEVSFPINIHALGKIEFIDDHVGLITRVVGFMTDYIDIFLFKKSTGTLKSMVAAFEAKHEYHGHPEEGYEAVYNTSTITEDRQINWHQERYGVTTDRIFDVSPDGYFRVIFQKQEVEFEY